MRVGAGSPAQDRPPDTELLIKDLAGLLDDLRQQT